MNSPLQNADSQVAQFIKTYIHSVWQLELILFLRVSAKPLTLVEIGNKLYMEPSTIEVALSRFEEQGLLESASGMPKTYKYQPETKELESAIEQTAKAYSERRVTIIDLIFASP